MRVGCVLLAAGSGRRFGENKLLFPVEGVPLYRRVLSACAGVPFARRVVVSRYPPVLSGALACGFAPVFNAGAEEGIAASVRLGAAAMQGLDGALFAVCDQPYLTTESIRRLLNAFMESPHRIHALSWRGERGNPVLFPGDLLGELAGLTGDLGGARVIRRHPERLSLVEAARARELWDIDRREDLLPAAGKDITE